MRISDWSSDVCSSDLPRKPDRAVLRCAACPSGCGAVPLLPTDAHRGRAGAARAQGKDSIMTKIGSFTKTASGEYQGEIVTLSVQAQSVRIVPDANASGNARSEEHTSKHKPIMPNPHADFRLKK